MWTSICTHAQGPEILGANLYFITARLKMYIFPPKSSDYVITCLKGFDGDYHCLLGSKWLWLFITQDETDSQVGPAFRWKKGQARLELVTIPWGS